MKDITLRERFNQKYDNDELELRLDILEFLETEIANARKEMKEENIERIKELHRNSERRTSELECSQDWYEYWLEDSIQSLS